ncbi:hypothetical protein AFE_2168 [Acidithiobacillus ferrooxidans ATCC 23270]|uniref:Uncharacterized protein n=1 Tax=Acidithiobacillus ferrooxidans (strain ATCC 23270 / DSM 14882 / CIP 104768 / NCIMB 8455) TaxID=243159 RepID=B7J5F7_ACIF2|nr:hypothetical protein AFE_2168 [Acidithiobacillus ferrooxidans ATCC 23270]
MPNNAHVRLFCPLRPTGLEKQPRLPKFHALAFKNRPGLLLDRYYQFLGRTETRLLPDNYRLRSGISPAYLYRSA